ncbi:RNA polymerase subunit sigma-70 [Streptomyces sp. YC504]|uniref:RNA polymerase subunit sigma-70 n=1 Tax=Streptomyces mesophilus TaxID=1775132 RepID=A0A6G4XU99_9ACTN|nr:sigma factor-like helix-turn-helix DNA-binding protein [Streptomyces mesophilus]NGO81179.1 RNA polymerase subunit sigma-70 [Streptomyces mesophilus]
MRERQTVQLVRRARDFESFVAGAAGRLLHAATLLTAEPPDDNPRARRLLTAALARTYASWDRLHGEDPYTYARQQLAYRFLMMSWRLREGRGGALGMLSPQERLVLVLRVHEGVAEEQTAALLGLPMERVRTLCFRAMSLVLAGKSGALRLTSTETVRGVERVRP